MFRYIASFILATTLVFANLFAPSDDDFLEPNEAFKTHSFKEGEYIEFEIKLGKNIYLYQDKLELLITSPSKIDITNKIKLPDFVEYNESKAIFDQANISVPTSLIDELVDSGEFALELKFQGCSSAGLCYAPMSAFYNQSASIKSKDEIIKPLQTIQTVEEEPILNETEEIASIFDNSNIYIVLITFFGFGLLLSLTPCVFPMIPILSSILVSHSNKQELSSKRGFFLSLVYVLSMSSAYAIAGIIAGIFGANLQSALQNPIVLTLFAAVFVALGLSMFGYFEIRVPAFIQNRLSKSTEGKENQGIVGIAAMGFLSALIVGPCVAPPLAGALVYISQTGDALLGGLALFVLSIGMGVPLLLIGFGAGKFMPKPGGWMENVTRFFGVVMFGLAIWMLDRVLDPSITLILWSVLFVSSSVYLGLFEATKEGIVGIKKLKKVLEIFLVVIGISLFIGALSGATNPLKPFEGFTSGAKIENSNSLEFKELKTLQDLKSVVSSDTKPIMIKFTASWCSSCKELENITLKDQEVIKTLSKYQLYKVDISSNTQDDKEILAYFGLFGPPALLFFENQKELKSKRVVGYKSPKEFISNIQ